MDQQREHILDDLRGLIAGDVHCDDVSLQLYASDASIYQIKPLGVVRPKTTADISACVRYAAEKEIPLHARGSGSGKAGESLGTGLILDFSRYFRRVVHTDAETVRVQAGIPYERLGAHLARHGRLFGPDPANAQITTIGGLLGVDGSGSRWLKYGSARRHTRSLRVVLADGEVMEVGREPINGTASGNPRRRRLVDALVRILRQNAGVIQSGRRASRIDRCGYQLADVLNEEYLDLAKLLVGSEGTLALITEVLLDTQPIPRCRGVTLLLFDTLESACKAVLDILPLAPVACDLIDRRHLGLARELEVRFDLLIPRETEAVLLVEQDGDDPHQVRQRQHELVDSIWHKRRLAFGARQAFDPAEVELYWQLATKITASLSRLKGPARPIPLIEDVAVPPEILPEFVVRTQNILKRAQVTASLYAHAGHGQLHIRPMLDPSNPQDMATMPHLAESLYKAVIEAGGTISGEHGCGISRTPFVRRQCGPLYDVFVQIKRLFDPQNIFNPGKIVGDKPDGITRNLRPIVAGRTTAAPKAEPGGGPEEALEQDETTAPKLRDLVELQLDWNPDRVVEAAVQCNGCGECRSQAPDVRMCPIFRIRPAEEASPRAKANLIRGVLGGDPPLESLTGEQFKDVADLCIHCQMCVLECPAEVDIPRIVSEGRGAFVAANGLPFSDWVITRLDRLAALGSIVRPLSNWVLGNPQMRWVLEKTLGIGRHRKLPRLAAGSFLRRSARRRLTRPTRRSGRKVLYFVDTYANFFDPQLGEALVAILEHNGVAVYVHPQQKQAGMSAVACGELNHARRLARHNVDILAEATRHGYHIVATEPAAALCLRQEYPNLLDDDDATLVAENTSEACTYLWRMHTAGQLHLDLAPINLTAGYHAPCHLKALRVGTPGEKLLGLIPGLIVKRIEHGCSGMAGTFGLQRKNYRNSLRAGWKLITGLRDRAVQVGTSECSACKIQMEQATTKPTIHPLKLLAMAYGLMPEVTSRLTAQSQELTVT